MSFRPLGRSVERLESLTTRLLLLLAGHVAVVAAGAAALISGSKGGAAVVAGAAVFALIKGGHVKIARRFGRAASLLKQAIVTVNAVEAHLVDMKVVAEAGNIRSRHGCLSGDSLLLLR